MVPIAVAVLFVAIGLCALTNGHPNEDAYILFTYVENFVAGHGISYYPGGELTQGFTDLVWFFLLSALHWAGMNVAVAACLVSACCAAALAWLLSWLAPKGWAWRIIIVLFCLAFHGSVASLGGFGTLLFCALTAFSYAAVRFRWPRAQLVLMALLPLVRLEGVACGAVLGMLFLWSNRSIRSSILAVACFGVPFVLVTGWRGWYFGDPMPLPFYVKSDLSSLPGLLTNFKWLYRETGPLPFLLAGVVAVRLAPMKVATVRMIAVAALPSLVVLAPLLMAEQLQNVRWRFQSPATLVCVCFCLESLAAVSRARRPRWVLAALAVVAFAPAIVLGTKHIFRLAKGEPRLHAHRFVPALASSLPYQLTIVTTEAGVVSYWLDKWRCVDIVGLNTLLFSRWVVRPDSISDLEPDVVVFNTYDVIELERFSWHGRLQESGFACIGRGPLLLNQPLHAHSRLEAAAAACVTFLSENRGYDVFVVREGRNVLVWAFRRNLWELPTIEEYFRAAADPTGHRGYLETVEARRK